MHTLLQLTGRLLPIKITSVTSLLTKILPLLLLSSSASAQLSLSVQLRTRTELRDGQGAPLPKGVSPAVFTSQRSRLMLNYSTYRLKLGLSLQDVRVWGQDGSTINRTTTESNNGLLLHEAWAEILLSDTADKKNSFSVKLGRQELVYDDQRLIGNLDWLQQARRHDAIVFKYLSGGLTAHAGFAFSQNKENASSTIYNPTPAGNYTANTNGGAMYKSLQYIHLNKKNTRGTISLLAFADQFNKYHNDMATGKAVKVFDSGVWGRYTTGFYFLRHIHRLDLNGAAYYQFGKNSDGAKLSGALLSLATTYNFTDKFSAGPGYDYTTGGSTAGRSNAFDPLYGTPHKFWGLMDYFYAASGFGNKGLADYYLKTKYSISKTIGLNADLHEFGSASAIYNAAGQQMNRNFGTEIDLVLSYTLSKYIGLESGYSHFFSTGSLTSAGVKNIANASNNSNWAYISLNIRPDLFSK
ncbi:MAG TPA: alginate export family protein [Puia sp.]|nr:alginate export family protein [Puia sp.]